MKYSPIALKMAKSLMNTLKVLGLFKLRTIHDRNAKYLFLETPKKVPILAKCEVLVVGGGPSGLSAAISSARAGADTILCERFGCFGGVITTVGMETIAWYRYEGCSNDSEVILKNNFFKKTY